MKPVAKCPIAGYPLNPVLLLYCTYSTVLQILVSDRDSNGASLLDCGFFASIEALETDLATPMRMIEK
jgi:hypothetical protein